MSRFRWGFRWGAAVLAALLGTTSGSVSLAKPPDLPAGHDIRCPEGPPGPEGRDEPAHGQFRFNWDVLRGQLRVEVENGSAAPAEPLILDVWCPGVMPLLVQRIGQRLLEGMPPRDPSTGTVLRGEAGDVPMSPDLAARAEQARMLYEAACGYEREGNLEQARAFLREAHLANPTCLHGRLAIRRLQELESDDHESCEEPVRPKAAPRPTGEPPLYQEPQSDEDAASRAQRTFRRVRQTTVPLGLVPMDTY
jgi:hypothetical protein